MRKRKCKTSAPKTSPRRGNNPLREQVEAVFRHTRQGSRKTRRRYQEACLRFANFLWVEFRLQKLSNISAKHLCLYINYMIESELSPAYIKTELSAIRFLHDHVSDNKYYLPRNEEIADRYGILIDLRTFGDRDRTWNDDEYAGMLALAEAEGEKEVAFAIQMGRKAGLRLHEVCRLDRATAEEAIRDQQMTVIGKNGRVRTIPVSKEVVDLLGNIIVNVPRGHKLIVPPNMKTHQMMYHIEQYIYTRRHKVQREGRDVPMTFHGLRHSFATEAFLDCIAAGMSKEAAYYAVSNLLGHNRKDVTRQYLASIKDGLDGLP